MSKKAFTSRGYEKIAPAMVEIKAPKVEVIKYSSNFAFYDAAGILTGTTDSHYIDITSLTLPANFNFENFKHTEIRLNTYPDDLLAVSARYIENKLIFKIPNHPKTIPGVKISVPLKLPKLVNPDLEKHLEELTMGELVNLLPEKHPKLKPRKGTWSRRSAMASKETSVLRYDPKEDEPLDASFTELAKI